MIDLTTGPRLVMGPRPVTGPRLVTVLRPPVAAPLQVTGGRPPVDMVLLHPAKDLPNWDTAALPDRTTVPHRAPVPGTHPTGVHPKEGLHPAPPPETPSTGALPPMVEMALPPMVEGALPPMVEGALGREAPHPGTITSNRPETRTMAVGLRPVGGAMDPATMHQECPVSIVIGVLCMQLFNYWLLVCVRVRIAMCKINSVFEMIYQPSLIVL